VDDGIVLRADGSANYFGISQLERYSADGIGPLRPDPAVRAINRSARGGYLVTGFNQPLNQVPSHESICSGHQHSHEN